MARIFISYKHVDKDAVLEVKNRIEKAIGEKCWMDMDGTEDDPICIQAAIEALDEADIMLFMYSTAHATIEDYENDRTINEVKYAKQKSKRIIFIKLDDTPKVFWFIKTFDLWRQVNIKSHQAMNKLFDDLKNGFQVIKLQNLITAVKDYCAKNNLDFLHYIPFAGSDGDNPDSVSISIAPSKHGISKLNECLDNLGVSHNTAGSFYDVQIIVYVSLRENKYN